MRSKSLKSILFSSLALLMLFALLTFPQLELPAPTGPHAVGRTVLRWQDNSRPEVMTDNPNDFRELIATIWYPAEPGTGTKTPYFPGLSVVSEALVESGEVASWQVYGLPFIRSENLLDANAVTSQGPYPVLILSPGNGTNIEFYTSLASEIASHGYVVVGINHPYDVAAVELSNGVVAPYNKEQWSLAPSAHQAYTRERIKVRTADIVFVLSQLELINSDPNRSFNGMMDLDSVAVGGHSLGGITASEACKAGIRLRACLNFDGLLEGGPFSTDASAVPPKQPFMFITKESELHPKLIESFESIPESYWVVIHGASHSSFTDGPLLQPSIWPLSNRADQVMGLIKEYTLAFLNQTLKESPNHLFSESIDQKDVSVRVFPSN